MFKFYTKGDGSYLEGAVFYNGQRILTMYMNKHHDEILVEIVDGADNVMADWIDFEESD